MAIGFVYLIRNSMTNHYKIGITNNVQDRLQHLQTANSAKLELLTSVKTSDPPLLEKELHTKFAVKRLEGEWFKLTNVDVEYVVQRFKDVQQAESEKLQEESWFDEQLAKLTQKPKKPSKQKINYDGIYE